MNHQKLQLLKTILDSKSLRLNRLLCNHLLRANSTASTASSTGNFENRNILKLKDRGLIVGIFPDQNDAFNKLISSSAQSVYCGFDPTASSLHIGNLLAIILLIHCQRAGHTPICVVGSATALIGDPSGRTTERGTIENKDVVYNTNNIQKLIARIFKNHEEIFWSKEKNFSGQLPQLKILNNIKWYEDMNIIKFLSSFGKYLRMGDLLSRKQIVDRLASKEGINYTEFSYQVFQAYDWLHLRENHKCNIQIGGNDQTGNIKTGYDLISKIDGKANNSLFGITIPIVTSDKGEKLGKSAGNAVWLDANQFSAFAFYQFFVNTPDQMVETYLKIFTFYSLSEIEEIMRKHKVKPELFTAQKKLAESLTKLVHSESGYESALKCTQALFSNDREALATMTKGEIENTFKAASVTTLTMEPGLSVGECAMKAKCFKNIDECAQIIRAGGFRMNHTLITNPEEVMIYGQHILNNDITVIRVGKKRYFLVKWLA